MSDIVRGNRRRHRKIGYVAYVAQPVKRVAVNRKRPARFDRAGQPLTELQAEVLGVLTDAPMRAALVARRLGVTPSQANGALLSLQAKDRAGRAVGGGWVRA